MKLATTLIALPSDVPGKRFYCQCLASSVRYLDGRVYLTSNISNSKGDFSDVILDRKHENVGEFSELSQRINVQVPGGGISQRVPRRNIFPDQLPSRRRSPRSQLLISHHPLK
jgi:hypothetical protein